MSLGVRLLMASNVFIFRLTGGRLGNRMGGQDVLLLHTQGRKSGKAYTTPVNYYRDGAHYVLVASNWGGQRQPAWYYNLLAGEGAVQVGRQTIPVRAHPAEGEDYRRLWQMVTARNPFYARYQQQTTRQIPILVLEPTANGAPPTS